MPPSLTLFKDSTPLAHQVAGHQNVLSDASGSLVIKPAVPREIAFYQLISSARKSSALARLKPFVPQFYGTLRLEGRMEGENLNTDVPELIAVPESVVLENLAHQYTHPSILDVKLGTVLHSPSAPLAKRLKMEHQAKSSTSHETGIRLTGCQTWHKPTQSFILTPKSYGKGIRKEDLKDGLIRFFPMPHDKVGKLIGIEGSDTPSSNGLCLEGTLPSIDISDVRDDVKSPSGFGTNASSTLVIDGEVTDSIILPSSIVTQPITPTTASTSTTFTTTSAPSPKLLTPTTANSSSFYTNHQIPPSLLLRVLTLLEEELIRLISVISTIEMRFVGSSLLIVYEGDEERLSKAFERLDKKVGKEIPKFREPDGVGNEFDDDDEEEGDSDEESEGEEEDSDSEEGSESDSLDGVAADARLARRCPPLTVRMIDFAHTRLAQGEEADQGVLLGLMTLVELIRGRKREIEGFILEEKKMGKII